MRLTLFTCTRIVGTPRITEKACRTNKRIHREECRGCPGVRILSERAGETPRAFDEASVVPLSEIERGRFKRRYHRLAQEAEDPLQPPEVSMGKIYEPQKHMTTEEIRKACGLSATGKVVRALERAGIEALGSVRLAGRRGRAPLFWDRRQVLSWLAKRKTQQRDRSGIPPPRTPPPPTSSAGRNGSSDPPAYREVLASLRGIRDEKLRAAEKAKEELELAQANYEEARDAWHAAQNAFEAVERAAGIR